MFLLFFADQEISKVNEILAAILHLTNIQFEEEGGHCDRVRVQNRNQLRKGQEIVVCFDKFYRCQSTDIIIQNRFGLESTFH